jgi:predicted dehydrogenase
MPVVDYTRSRATTRARKAARYVRLYGIRRTLSKIEGQYHMSGRRSPVTRSTNAAAHVGLIGCGNFAYTTIAHYLERNVGAVVRGTMDIVGERAESLARRYGGQYATTDAERLLSDPQIDLVYVASNHASHADYAIRALEQGKAVHIEKPHVVDHEQLERLHAAMLQSQGRVRLGFNRPVSALAERLRELVSVHTGPITASWFVVGYRLPSDHWYNDPREGGRVVGNVCHWTDFAYHLVDADRRHPIEVHPVQSADDVMVCLVFGDGSSTSITFAASGDIFEGVRETLGLQRGDLVARLTDFQYMRVDVGDWTRRFTTRRRDHGHESAMMLSYAMSARGGGAAGETARYVWETGDLFLKVRDALATGERVIVTGSPKLGGDSAVPE